MPDLFEFNSQFPARGSAELVPTVEQQQHTAAFGEPEHVILAYVAERWCRLASKLEEPPDQSPNRK